MKNVLFYVALTLFSVTSIQLFSQTTFTGAIDSDWSNPGNWDNGLPTVGNDAEIPPGSSVQVNSAIVVDYYVSNEGSFTNNSEITVEATGYLDNFEAVINFGTLNILSGASLVTNDLFENHGVVNNAGSFFNDRDFHNLTGATFIITNYFDNTDYVNNEGVILVQQLGYLSNADIIDNTGIILVYDTIDNQGDINGTVLLCGGTFFGNDPTEGMVFTCPNPETCDGNDNDLDGQVDEDCGCMNSLACNYDSAVTIDDGSCLLGSGCTDTNACNYDASANCDDGSCLTADACGVCGGTGTLAGCTDPADCNYNPAADCDDGSCSGAAGCTDSSACNYDPSAGCDDGSCLGMNFDLLASGIVNLSRTEGAFGDVDGDGDLDYMICGWNGISSQSTLHLNDGTGSFLQSPESFSNVHDATVDFADVDSDGDLDLLITGFNPTETIYQAQLYLNDGAGAFALVAGTPFIGVEDGDASFADVDGDNDLDVMVCGNHAAGTPSSTLYINDGTGNFSVDPQTFPGVEDCAISFFDVNGDGTPDLLLSGQLASDDTVVLYTNTGGIFTEVLGTPFEGAQRTGLDHSDIDGDGDLDVLIAGNPIGALPPYLELFLNDGTGNFSLDASSSFTGVDFASIRFADVDGDGDEDVFVTGRAGGQKVANLYENNSGVFTDYAGGSFVGSDDGSIDFGDIDGDGDLDLFYAGVLNSGNQGSALWENNSTLPAVSGCTDVAACNYNSSANCDDDSCLSLDACGICGGTGATPGCIDPTACNYDSASDCDDGSCAYSTILSQDICVYEAFLGACGAPTSDCTGFANEGNITFNQPLPGQTILGLNVEIKRHDEIGGGGFPSDLLIDFNGQNIVSNLADDFEDCSTPILSYSFTYETLPAQVPGANVLDVIFEFGDVYLQFVSVHVEYADAPIAACTDSNACNYNSLAVCDDDSCILPDGCTDITACNYDSTATCDDGSCTYPGCTNSLACNYDSAADCEDGSCILPDGCTNPVACNFNPTALCNDGTCILPDGCTNPAACNFNSAANCDDGSCELPDGCSDPTACNYDPSALCDDGTCILPDGCTNEYACNYNSNSICDDGTCILPPGSGTVSECVYESFPGACDGNHSGCQNYENISLPAYYWIDLPSQNVVDLTISMRWYASGGGTPSDLSILFNGVEIHSQLDFYGDCSNPDQILSFDYASLPGQGMGNTLEFYFNDPHGMADLYIQQISIEASYIGPFFVHGCTDSSACNYDSTATCDDGSCITPDGCVDPEACNYDSTALCDDGSCEFLSCRGCTVEVACNYDPAASIYDDSCEYDSCAGCMSTVACNYDSSATLEDGTCEYISCQILGCTSALACNYNPSATLEDGSCEFTSCAGCTAESACNYDSGAILDDGSCEFISCVVYGCMYADATNYDSGATQDDLSCQFEFANPCQFDFTDDGLVNTQDLLLFLGAFGSSCP